jgi:hypothetical protein
VVLNQDDEGTTGMRRPWSKLFPGASACEILRPGDDVGWYLADLPPEGHFYKKPFEPKKTKKKRKPLPERACPMCGKLYRLPQKFCGLRCAQNHLIKQGVTFND